MSRFAKSFATNAFGATFAALGLCSAAVALSASAAAEPAAPPAVPAVPALTMLQQFATNPASVGAVLQSAATALSGASSAIGGPAPATLPVSPIPGAPATAPVADPVAGVPGTGLVPLLTQFGVPANLVNLAPAPLQIGNALGIAPSAPIAPAMDPLTAPVAPAPAGAIPLLPVTPGTVPLLPVAPSANGTGSMPLINALP